MRRARPLAVTTTSPLEAPSRGLPLADEEAPPPPNPLPEPRTADRIRDALIRWLEEDM